MGACADDDVAWGDGLRVREQHDGYDLRTGDGPTGLGGSAVWHGLYAGVRKDMGCDQDGLQMTVA